MSKKNMLCVAAQWLIAGAVIVILMSSCSRRMVVDNSMGGCGVWYPKKFGGQRGW